MNFQQALQTLGVDRALAVLNEGSPCRFSGIFELLGDTLVIRHFYDRLGEPRAAFLEAVPFVDSFCQLAIRHGEFRTTNAALDSRVDYSPYKYIVVSYFAVPVVDDTLQLTGTLCHFDTVERELTPTQFLALHEAAKMLPAHLSAERRRAPV